MEWIPVILVLPYLCMLLGIYKGLRKLKPFKPENPGNEFISIVVSCRNEQDNLPHLLNDLISQNYPDNLFEIIIIDDNSTDRTFDIASGFKSLKNISVFRNTGNGKKAGISTGVKASKGALIVTTDADCRMGKNWLGTLSSFYKKSGADLIVSPVRLKEGKGFFGRFLELEFLSLQGVTAGSILSGNSTMCNGANLAFKKEIYLLNQENLHPEIPSGDDIFLLQSIKKNKQSSIEWLEATESVVTTVSPSLPGNFFDQRRRWISKAKVYDDPYTIILGIVTFVTILLQVSALVTGLFNHPFIYIYLILLILKSIPDYLILMNTTARYGKRHLMVWFIPSQILYPFYVLIIACYAFLVPGQRN
jgi:poly-beta-1,6-N-acetyl-D-glucosamine synthase